MPEQNHEASDQATDAPAAIQQMFERLLTRSPKGFAGSSMGKFDEFRRWFADELDLGDYKTNTYAVGSGGIAHNFSARWAQNNTISGSHVSLGLAFLGIPEGVDENAHVETAANTSSKFVSGEKPTSYEAIIIFVRAEGENRLEPRMILALPESPVAAALLVLFPGLPVRTIDWAREIPPTRAALPTVRREPIEAKPLQPELTQQLETALEAASYRARFGLVGRVLASLAAKPFLILAGLSGSGKSLLGILTAHWLVSSGDQVEMVAVGADWTSKHHLLGYPDALEPSAFVGTPALDLLLRAVDDPENPYFLILDEMNLSHVERYFSDFLSAIESGQPINLHGGETSRNGVPESVVFPRNLFVIGTINVDETTYMFSPKVLDRANVVEFTVSREAMRNYLDGRREFDAEGLLGGGAAFGPSLVEFAGSPAHLSSLPDQESAEVVDTLDRLFAILDAAGMQLGFRTMREIIRYVIASRKLAGDTSVLHGALDAQIAQRILPKLSGDLARLKPILIALLAFCVAAAHESLPEEATIAENAERLFGAQPEALRRDFDIAASRFPIASDKIERMLARLNEYGFTTAIEA